MHIENGVWAREMSLEQYVCDKVKTDDNYLLDKTKGNWRILMKRTDNNFAMGYDPNFDNSIVLDSWLASYYQSKTDLMIWMVELGRIDTNTKI